MEDIESFSGFNILPGEKVKVQAPVDAEWSMTAVSILPDEKTPENGRVVLYAEGLVAGKDEVQPVAIAALRVNSMEVVNVNLRINCFTPLTLYTKGDALTVSVSGVSSTLDKVILEKL